MTFYICFGKWAEPCLEFKEKNMRICLGFMAIGIFFVDIEEYIVKATELLKKLKKHV